jgi:hypothetical protein
VRDGIPYWTRKSRQRVKPDVVHDVSKEQKGALYQGVSATMWVNLFVDLAAPTVQSKADITDRPKLSAISGIPIARQKEVPELNGKRKATLVTTPGVDCHFVRGTR